MKTRNAQIEPDKHVLRYWWMQGFRMGVAVGVAVSGMAAMIVAGIWWVL